MTISEKQITFDLIIPEYDILNCEGGNSFVNEKVIPVKRLALYLWKEKLVDTIQTSVELDCGQFSLHKISSGENISVNPFAILKKDAYQLFSENYFDNYTISYVENNGVLAESDENILHYL